jgi:hypothetical protein
MGLGKGNEVDGFTDVLQFLVLMFNLKDAYKNPQTRL